MFTDDQGARHETPDEMSIDHKLDLILAEMHNMKSGFPKSEDGSVDYDGHRKYHEQLIKAAEAQTEFWRELRLDIAKKGAWSLLVIVLGLVSIGLLAKLGLYKP